MKRLVLALLFLALAAPCMAASVGGPDISIPEASSFLKQDAVNNTLDKDEYNMNVKASMEIEIVADRDLTSAEADTPAAELSGHAYIVKLANNFFDIFEPYVELGTSRFDVEWNQYGDDIKIESNPGFTWGLGFKMQMFESKDYGVKLTLDAKYRSTKMDIDRAKLGGSASAASAVNEEFEIEEWHISLLGSKRYIIPLGASDFYVVPYAGFTYSVMDVNARFTRSTNGILYSTFDASDDNPLGIVLGCDLMPFYLSNYLWNVELRLINETAFTLGGTIKF